MLLAGVLYRRGHRAGGGGAGSADAGGRARCALPVARRRARQQQFLAFVVAAALARGRGGSDRSAAGRPAEIAVGAQRFAQPPQNPHRRLPRRLHRQLQPGRSAPVQTESGRRRVGRCGAALRGRGGAGAGGGVLRRLGGGKRTQSLGDAGAAHRLYGRDAADGGGDARRCAVAGHPVAAGQRHGAGVRRVVQRAQCGAGAGGHQHALFRAGRGAAEHADFDRQARRGSGADSAEARRFAPGALRQPRLLPAAACGRRATADV